jgi:hypothetical protein
MSTPLVLHQVLSSIGALFILVAYFGQIRKFSWMSIESAPYHLLNTIGSVLLCYVAARPLQVGFFVMDVIWAVVSFIELVKVLRKKA